MNENSGRAEKKGSILGGSPFRFAAGVPEVQDDFSKLSFREAATKEGESDTEENDSSWSNQHDENESPSLSSSTISSRTTISTFKKEETEEETIFQSYERCTLKLNFLLELLRHVFSKKQCVENVWADLSTYLDLDCSPSFLLNVKREPSPTQKSVLKMEMEKRVGGETEEGKNSACTCPMAQEDAMICDKELSWFTELVVFIQALFMCPRTAEESSDLGSSSETSSTEKKSTDPTAFWPFFCVEDDVGSHSLAVWRRVYANGLSVVLSEIDVFDACKSSFHPQRREHASLSASFLTLNEEDIAMMQQRASFRAMLEWVSVSPVVPRNGSFSSQDSDHGVSKTSNEKNSMEMGSYNKSLGPEEVAFGWSSFLRLYPFLNTALQELLSSSTGMDCTPSPFTLSAVLMIDTLYWISSWRSTLNEWEKMTCGGIRVLWWYEPPQLLWEWGENVSLPNPRKGAQHQVYFLKDIHRELGSLGDYGPHRVGPWVECTSPSARSLFAFPHPQQEEVSPFGGFSHYTNFVTNAHRSHILSLSPIDFLPFRSPRVVLDGAPSPWSGGSHGEENFNRSLPTDAFLKRERLLSVTQLFLDDLYALLRLESRNVEANPPTRFGDGTSRNEGREDKKEEKRVENDEKNDDGISPRLTSGIAVPTAWMASLVSWIEACQRLPCLGMRYHTSSVNEKKSEEEWMRSTFPPPPPGAIPTLCLPCLEREGGNEASWRSPVRHRFYESMGQRRQTTPNSDSSLPLVEVIPSPLFDFLLAHFGMVGVKYPMRGAFFHRHALLTALKPLSIAVEFNFERRIIPAQGTNNGVANGSGTLQVGSKEMKVLSDRQFVTLTVEAVPRTTIADALRSAVVEAKLEGEMSEEEEATWLRVCTETMPGGTRESDKRRWFQRNHEGETPFLEADQTALWGSTAQFSTSITSSTSVRNAATMGGVENSTDTIVFVSFLNLELFPPPPAPSSSSSLSEFPPGPHLPHSSVSTGASRFYSPLSAERPVSVGNEPLSSIGLKEIDVTRERVGDVLDRLRAFCDQAQRPWPLSQTSREETMTLTINAHYRFPLQSVGTTTTTTTTTTPSIEDEVDEEVFNRSIGKLRKECSTVVPGTCGISNIGNTCFMNSAIQCLAHLPLFRDALLSLILSSSFGDKILVSKALQSILVSMWEENPPKALSIMKHKREIGWRCPRYKDFDQQDASEFMDAVLSCASEELNTCMVPNYRQKSDADLEIPRGVLLDLYWENFLQNNNSFLSEMFFFQSFNFFTCCSCHRTSIVPENRSNLSLPIVQVESVEVEVTVVLEILSHEEVASPKDTPASSPVVGEEEKKTKKKKKTVVGSSAFQTKTLTVNESLEERQERLVCLHFTVNVMDALSRAETEAASEQSQSALKAPEVTSYYHDRFLSVPLLSSSKLKFVCAVEEELEKRIREDPRVGKKISDVSSRRVTPETREGDTGEGDSPSDTSPTTASVPRLPSPSRRLPPPPPSSLAPTPSSSSNTTMRGTGTTPSGKEMASAATPFSGKMEFVHLWEQPGRMKRNVLWAYVRCGCDPPPAGVTATPQRIEEAPRTPPPVGREEGGPQRTASASGDRTPAGRSGTPPSHPPRSGRQDGEGEAVCGGLATPATGPLFSSLPVWYCFLPLPSSAVEGRDGHHEGSPSHRPQVVYMDDFHAAYAAALPVSSDPAAPSFSPLPSKEDVGGGEHDDVEEWHDAMGGSGAPRARPATPGDVDETNGRKEEEEEEEDGRGEVHAVPTTPAPLSPPQNEKKRWRKRAEGHAREGGTPRHPTPSTEKGETRSCAVRTGFTAAILRRVVALKAHHLVRRPSWGGIENTPEWLGSNGEKSLPEDEAVKGRWGRDTTFARHPPPLDVVTPLPPPSDGNGERSRSQCSSGRPHTHRSEGSPSGATSGTLSTPADADPQADAEKRTPEAMESPKTDRRTEEEEEAAWWKESMEGVCVWNLIPPHPFSPLSTSGFLAGGNRLPDTTPSLGSSESPLLVTRSVNAPSSSSPSSSLEDFLLDMNVLSPAVEITPVENHWRENTLSNFDDPEGIHTKKRSFPKRERRSSSEVTSFHKAGDAVSENRAPFVPAKRGQTGNACDGEFIGMETLWKAYGDRWGHRYFLQVGEAIEKAEKEAGVGLHDKGRSGSNVSDISSFVGSFSSTEKLPPAGGMEGEKNEHWRSSTGTTRRREEKDEVCVVSHRNGCGDVSEGMGEEGNEKSGRKRIAPPLVIVVFYDSKQYTLDPKRQLLCLPFDKTFIIASSGYCGEQQQRGDTHDVEQKREDERRKLWETLYLESNGESSLGLSLYKVFLQPQVLSGNDAWYCPGCQSPQTATVRPSLFRLPPCLLMTFNRFQQQRYRAEKNDTFVQFPDRIDLAPFLDKDADVSQGTKYALQSVLYHCGSLNFGHYIACAYVPSIKKWVKFNDSKTTVIEGSPEREGAYVVCYTREK